MSHRQFSPPGQHRTRGGAPVALSHHNRAAILDVADGARPGDVRDFHHSDMEESSRLLRQLQQGSGTTHLRRSDVHNIVIASKEIEAMNRQLIDELQGGGNNNRRPSYRGSGEYNHNHPSSTQHPAMLPPQPTNQPPRAPSPYGQDTPYGESPLPRTGKHQQQSTSAAASLGKGDGSRREVSGGASSSGMAASLHHERDTPFTAAGLNTDRRVVPPRDHNGSNAHRSPQAKPPASDTYSRQQQPSPEYRPGPNATPISKTKFPGNAAAPRGQEGYWADEVDDTRSVAAPASIAGTHLSRVSSTISERLRAGRISPLRTLPPNDALPEASNRRPAYHTGTASSYHLPVDTHTSPGGRSGSMISEGGKVAARAHGTKRVTYEEQPSPMGDGIDGGGRGDWGVEEEVGGESPPVVDIPSIVPTLAPTSAGLATADTRTRFGRKPVSPQPAERPQWQERFNGEVGSRSPDPLRRIDEESPHRQRKQLHLSRAQQVADLQAKFGAAGDQFRRGMSGSKPSRSSSPKGPYQRGSSGGVGGGYGDDGEWSAHDDHAYPEGGDEHSQDRSPSRLASSNRSTSPNNNAFTREDGSWAKPPPSRQPSVKGKGKDANTDHRPKQPVEMERREPFAMEVDVKEDLGGRRPSAALLERLESRGKKALDRPQERPTRSEEPHDDTNRSVSPTPNPAADAPGPTAPTPTRQKAPPSPALPATQPDVPVVDKSLLHNPNTTNSAGDSRPSGPSSPPLPPSQTLPTPLADATNLSSVSDDSSPDNNKVPLQPDHNGIASKSVSSLIPTQVIVPPTTNPINPPTPPPASTEEPTLVSSTTSKRPPPPPPKRASPPTPDAEGISPPSSSPSSPSQNANPSDAAPGSPPTSPSNPPTAGSGEGDPTLVTVSASRRPPNKPPPKKPLGSTKPTPAVQMEVLDAAPPVPSPHGGRPTAMRIADLNEEVERIESTELDMSTRSSLPPHRHSLRTLSQRNMPGSTLEELVQHNPDLANSVGADGHLPDDTVIVIPPGVEVRPTPRTVSTPSAPTPSAPSPDSSSRVASLRQVYGQGTDGSTPTIPPGHISEFGPLYHSVYGGMSPRPSQPHSPDNNPISPPHTAPKVPPIVPPLSMHRDPSTLEVHGSVRTQRFPWEAGSEVDYGGFCEGGGGGGGGQGSERMLGGGTGPLSPPPSGRPPLAPASPVMIKTAPIPPGSGKNMPPPPPPPSTQTTQDTADLVVPRSSQHSSAAAAAIAAANAALQEDTLARNGVEPGDNLKKQRSRSEEELAEERQSRSYSPNFDDVLEYEQSRKLSQATLQQHDGNDHPRQFGSSSHGASSDGNPPTASRTGSHLQQGRNQPHPDDNDSVAVRSNSTAAMTSSNQGGGDAPQTVTPISRPPRRREPERNPYLPADMYPTAPGTASTTATSPQSTLNDDREVSRLLKGIEAQRRRNEEKAAARKADMERERLEREAMIRRQQEAEDAPPSSHDSDAEDQEELQREMRRMYREASRERLPVAHRAGSIGRSPSGDDGRLPPPHHGHNRSSSRMGVDDTATSHHGGGATTPTTFAHAQYGTAPPTSLCPTKYIDNPDHQDACDVSSRSTSNGEDTYHHQQQQEHPHQEQFERPPQYAARRQSSSSAANPLVDNPCLAAASSYYTAPVNPINRSDSTAQRPRREAERNPYLPDDTTTPLRARQEDREVNNLMKSIEAQRRRNEEKAAARKADMERERLEREAVLRRQQEAEDEADVVVLRPDREAFEGHLVDEEYPRGPDTYLSDPHRRSSSSQHHYVERRRSRGGDYWVGSAGGGAASAHERGSLRRGPSCTEISPPTSLCPLKRLQIHPGGHHHRSRTPPIQERVHEWFGTVHDKRSVSDCYREESPESYRATQSPIRSGRSPFRRESPLRGPPPYRPSSAAVASQRHESLELSGTGKFRDDELAVVIPEVTHEPTLEAAQPEAKPEVKEAKPEATQPEAKPEVKEAKPEVAQPEAKPEVKEAKPEVAQPEAAQPEFVSIQKSEAIPTSEASKALVVAKPILRVQEVRSTTFKEHQAANQDVRMSPRRTPLSNTPRAFLGGSVYNEDDDDDDEQPPPRYHFSSRAQPRLVARNVSRLPTGMVPSTTSSIVPHHHQSERAVGPRGGAHGSSIAEIRTPELPNAPLTIEEIAFNFQVHPEAVYAANEGALVYGRRGQDEGSTTYHFQEPLPGGLVLYVPLRTMR